MDYDEPQRGEILDYLFKPKFGASLHVLKLEIGGDSQTGFGTEPSHMHRTSDRSCVRGYEFWLLSEAKKRNPNIVTYAIAFGMPAWVGAEKSEGGFFSEEGIDYLVQWLSCCLELGLGYIDYLGHRSARPWNPPPGSGVRLEMVGSWTAALRASLDAAGFNHTKLVIPDGAWDMSVLSTVAANASFAAALSEGVMGLHYPCYAPHPEVRQAGLHYWSTEDGAVPGDWNGAGCIGRLLNHNFVQQNMSSTVMKSLVWSVYPGLTSQDSDAFLDAYEPWSGRYTVRDSVWAMAHTTQFVEVNWTILDIYEDGGDPTLGSGNPPPGIEGKLGSSGFLSNGGSFVTYQSPSKDHFSLVVEKLHGKCPKCPASSQFTTTEHLTFRLAGAPRYILPTDYHLSHWISNATHRFVQLPDLYVDPTTWSFQFVAHPDSIHTVTTTSGQTRGGIMPVTVTENGTTPMAYTLTPLGSTSTDASSAPVNVTNATLRGNETTGTAQTTLASLLLNQSTTEDVISTLDMYTNTSDATTNATVMIEMSRFAPQPGHHVAADVAFPLPHFDDFDATYGREYTYFIGASARYFVDYGGSWQVDADPTRPGNFALRQWVNRFPGPNQWATEVAPLTLIGFGMQDVAVSAVVYIPPVSAPLKVRSGTGPVLRSVQSAWSSRCLATPSGGEWVGATLVEEVCTTSASQRFSYDATSGVLAARPRPAWPASSTDGKPVQSASGVPGDAAPKRRSSGARDRMVQQPKALPGQSWRIAAVVGTSFCVTYSTSCASKQLCLMECGDSAVASGQSWDWGEDGTLRLRSQPSLCVTAAAAGPTGSSGSLRIASCAASPSAGQNSERPERQQQWLQAGVQLAAHAAVCARLVAPVAPFDASSTSEAASVARHRRGYCLSVGVDDRGQGMWKLEKGGYEVLTQGPLASAVGVWHSTFLHVWGTKLTVMVDGQVLATIDDSEYSRGACAVGSGWHETYVDDVAVEGVVGGVEGDLGSHWEPGGAPGRYSLEVRRRRWPAEFGWP